MQHECAKKFMQKDNTMTFSTAGRQQIAKQQLIQPRPKTMNPQPTPLCVRRQGFLKTLVLALLIVPATLSGENLLAQLPTPQATKPVRQQKAAAKSAHAASTQPQPAPEAIAAQSPSPSTPVWPANQPPSHATVSWDGRGLEIEASNSSLNQILQQVAADTGAKLEGLSQDQRVFGSYGPGPGRDVLLKLLDGSGYNVLMIGGRDSDVLREIVLSTRSPFSSQTAVSNHNRGNSEDDEAAERLKPKPQPDTAPQPDQNPFNIGGPPRDPQELMEEILQRQQKIDQQQQQGQQDGPQQ
jgi:hypothetical protein